MNYYISDLHLNHANIIKYCKRPFDDVEQMNEAIITNINKRVGDRDNLFVLGDVGFGAVGDLVPLIKRIRGRKTLVAGNHDKKHLKSESFRECFESIHEILEISDHQKKIVMFHYPMVSWNEAFHGSIHLYGHVHNNGVAYEAENAYNLCVEMTNYKPLTLAEILKMKDAWTLESEACVFLKKMI